jgi:hypothetical protein
MLGFLPGGDVELDPLIPRSPPSIVVRDDGRDIVEPDDAPVASDHPILELERLPRLDASSRLVQDLIAITRMEALDPQSWILRPFMRSEPQHRFDLRTDVFLRHPLEPARNAPHVHDRGDLLYERAISGFEVPLVADRATPCTGFRYRDLSSQLFRRTDTRTVTALCRTTNIDCR